MSKPVFQDLFKFSGRRNRQSYIYLQLASVVGAFLGLGIVTAVTVAAPVVGGILGFLGIVGLIAIAVANWAAASQRIRDFGYSGVWALLMLIPYVGFAFSLALWFVPSDEGDNKYGPSQITPTLTT
jgi:uncharacterized membrane protein YhaH (DUF805 family)